MKMLVLSDIHGKTQKVKDILSKEDDYDLIVLVGDITDFGPKKRAIETLDVIRGKTEDIIGIPGNCDPVGIEDVISEKAVLIDEKIARIDDVEFVGLGGSNQTPFDTPRERSEEEIREKLMALLSGVGEKSVLVSHAPAKGYLDLTSGNHAGSEGVLDAIEKYEPDLVISGHIHEAEGKKELNETTLVNPGAVKDGGYAKIDFNEEIKVDILPLA